MKVDRTIDGFLDWWVSGLLMLLPLSLSEKVRRTPDRLVLQLEDTSLTLQLYHGLENNLLQTRRLTKDDKLEIAALKDWLDELDDNNTEIILLLPTNKVLVKSLSLPTNAKDSLREILGFEMDRQTPFRSEQVYYDYLYSGSESAKDKLQIDLFVATKNSIDDLLSALKEWQIQAQRITIRQNDSLLTAVNLLPERLRTSSGNTTSKVTLGLATCSLLLFIAALYLPLASQEKKLAALETQINKHRVEAKKLLTLTTAKENMLSRSRFLEEKQASRIAPVDVLEELTRILPDDTWVNRLVVRDSKVQLQGESNTATAIIQLLENSDYFRNARFRSPVTHNNVTNKDKFNVSAQINKGGAI